MNKKIISLSIVSVFLLGSMAMAAGPTKLIPIKGKANDVSIDHPRHVKAVKDGGAGLKCTECHNSKLVAKMKTGANKITMAGTCGVCHSKDAKAKALDIANKETCAKCHVKPVEKPKA